MIRKTFALWIFGIGFILLIGLYYLTDSPQAKGRETSVYETDFNSFLNKFKLVKLPSTFAFDDFYPDGVICCTDGKYLDSKGVDVMTLMLSVPQLHYWVDKSKQLHPELKEWLNENGNRLEPYWFEIYAGIRVSLPGCEILSIHTYTATSATNGGDSDNWLLYFSKSGKLLKTEKLDQDHRRSSRETIYADDVEDHWEETNEVIVHVFHLQSEDSLVTEIRKSSSIEYQGILQDTSYFNKTVDDPVFVLSKFTK